MLERSRELQGYQLYAVEQWACSRNHPTLVIVTYTGDSNHSIKVGILGVPADEDAWSPKLKTYFRALAQYHARRRETPLGLLTVTNLSGFPSSLTLVPIPDGDLTRAREPFFLNEDLKRLGCSGRVGLTLSEPNAATQAKFHQLYKTSEKVPISQAVTELIRSCQISLMLFGFLDEAYMDGLLCDETERAINNWWSNIGSELYNIEPSDGILGPTTVAALLGALCGARNRLSVLNAPINKDVFDIDTTKRAIVHFQKTQRLHKSRRLDRDTFVRLHKATAKQATGEGFKVPKVPKVVKSTVAELSGKGGEMVMEMVGRDKTKISEVETVDYDAFIQLVTGDRARWLWHGKARKRATRDLFSDGIGSSAKDDGRQSFDEPGRRPSTESLKDEVPLEKQQSHAKAPSEHRGFFRGHRSTATEESLSKQTVLKRAKGLIRGQHTSSKSTDDDSPYMSARPSTDGRPSLEVTTSSKDFTIPSSSDASSLTRQTEHKEEKLSEAQQQSSGAETPTESNPASSIIDPGPGPVLAPPIDLEQKLERIISNEVAGTETETIEEDPEVFPLDDRPASHIGIYLRENSSFTRFQAERAPLRSEAYYAPRLSFSAAEDAVLAFHPLIDSLSHTHGQDRPSDLREELAHEVLAADRARYLRRAVASLGRCTGSWLQKRVHAVSELDDVVAGDVDQLQALLHPRLQEHASLAASAREIIGGERNALEDAIKDVETLGSKLAYELGSLRSKVEDLEGAVDEFQRQVEFTEGRVEELVRSSEKEGVGEWVMRTCFGVVRRKE